MIHRGDAKDAEKSKTTWLLNPRNCGRSSLQFFRTSPGRFILLRDLGVSAVNNPGYPRPVPTTCSRRRWRRLYVSPSVIKMINMSLMKSYLLPVLLLTISNTFMTCAWYGHLKFEKTALWIVACW